MLTSEEIFEILNKKKNDDGIVFKVISSRRWMHEVFYINAYKDEYVWSAIYKKSILNEEILGQVIQKVNEAFEKIIK